MLDICFVLVVVITIVMTKPMQNHEFLVMQRTWHVRSILIIHSILFLKKTNCVLLFVEVLFTLCWQPYSSLYVELYFMLATYTFNLEKRKNT